MVRLEISGADAHNQSPDRNCAQHKQCWIDFLKCNFFTKKENSPMCPSAMQMSDMGMDRFGN